MLILRVPVKVLVRSVFLPDFSDMLNLYVYVLFGSLLFVVILAAARAFGSDLLHHDIVDHGVDAGVGEISRVEISSEAQSSVEVHGASAGPGDKTGLVRFQGMVLMTISIFLVSFAAMGILGLYYVVRPYNLDPLTSIPVSAGSSAVLAIGISYGAFKYFVASAAGSEISLGEVVGKPCEVTVGTSGKDLGEVRCDVKGQIMSFPARSIDGALISSGDNAKIISMTGNIAVIQKRSNS